MLHPGTQRVSFPGQEVQRAQGSMRNSVPAKRGQGAAHSPPEVSALRATKTPFECASPHSALSTVNTRIRRGDSRARRQARTASADGGGTVVVPYRHAAVGGPVVAVMVTARDVLRKPASASVHVWQASTTQARRAAKRAHNHSCALQRRRAGCGAAARVANLVRVHFAPVSRRLQPLY